jgi:hypothetical protein
MRGLKIITFQLGSRPHLPVIASGGVQNERSKGWTPERSNPLPKTKRAFTKNRFISTVFATSYLGYRLGIASLRVQKIVSLIF